jgi:hypothetical protein
MAFVEMYPFAIFFLSTTHWLICMATVAVTLATPYSTTSYGLYCNWCRRAGLPAEADKILKRCAYHIIRAFRQKSIVPSNEHPFEKIT